MGDRWRLQRGADSAKDQSYVLSMLGQDVLARCRFPVGELTKSDVRAAGDSSSGCVPRPRRRVRMSVSSLRRADAAAFLADRMPLNPGRPSMWNRRRASVEVDAVELVTVGQRRGLGVGGGEARYAVAVDTVTRDGDRRWAFADLSYDATPVESLTWVDATCARRYRGAGANVGARRHRVARRFTGVGPCNGRRPTGGVAPGQTVAFYDPSRHQRARRCRRDMTPREIPRRKAHRPVKR